jgi:5-methylcytosine-specific restriction endonuclease McrA
MQPTDLTLRVLKLLVKETGNIVDARQVIDELNMIEELQLQRYLESYKNIRREISRVYRARARARQRKLSATLELIDWLDTLDHFDWKCAYCQKHIHEVLEHFIRIDDGGGTTVQNCVPACNSCNQRKERYTRRQKQGLVTLRIFPDWFEDAAKRVGEYLSLRISRQEQSDKTFPLLDLQYHD